MPAQLYPCPNVPALLYRSQQVVMPASLEHIHHGTPMGATLIADGATFRVWAPHARTVHVLGDFNDRQRSDASLLTRDDRGQWRGFIAGARDRHRYMFYVVGDGSEG